MPVFLFDPYVNWSSLHFSNHPTFKISSICQRDLFLLFLCSHPASTIMRRSLRHKQTEISRLFFRRFNKRFLSYLFLKLIAWDSQEEIAHLIQKPIRPLDPIHCKVHFTNTFVFIIVESTISSPLHNQKSKSATTNSMTSDRLFDQ